MQTFSITSVLIYEHIILRVRAVYEFLSVAGIDWSSCNHPVAPLAKQERCQRILVAANEILPNRNAIRLLKQNFYEGANRRKKLPQTISTCNDYCWK